MLRPPRVPAAGVLAAGLAAVAVLATGCRGADQPASSLPVDQTTAPTGSPAPTSPASTPTGPGSTLVLVTAQPPTDRVPARVFADYVTFWQRDMLALTTNDANRSGVIDYLFAPQLASTLAYLEGRRKTGVRSQGVLRIAPAVLRASGRTASVRDCLDQTGVVDVDRAGHQATLPARVPLTVQLVRTPDGRWRVSRLAQASQAGCS